MKSVAEACARRLLDEVLRAYSTKQSLRAWDNPTTLRTVIGVQSGIIFVLVVVILGVL